MPNKLFTITFMKNKSLYITLLIAAIYSLSVSVQANEYLPSMIPDSLKKDAFSIIRNYSVTLKQSDINNAVLEVTKVITVLEKKGDDAAVFGMYEDKSQEFKKFSGRILDFNGKVIKKIKQSDLLNHTLSESSINMDSRSYYYQPQSPVYPYTVEYTYQINYKNGLRGYYPLDPYDAYHQSVEKYSYTLDLPADVNLRHKSNFDIPIKKEFVGNSQLYRFSLKGLKALPYERRAPRSKELFPRILFAPSDFCYDSHCGNMSDWKNYGLWSSDLLKGRDVLPPDIVAKLQEMVKDAPDNKEKVKILYQHLQEHSRYVNIALGIGGYQPADAATTYKTRFGDCKGLTNLMKSMLKAVNIPSFYTLISMDEQDIYEDYPSFNQLNHVILMVPFEKDSVWLECTNSTLPFGYVHDNIAGNNAIIIHEDGKGGQFCTLPSYSVDQNKSETFLEINISENGKAEGKIVITENLHYYSSFVNTFMSKDREKYIENLNINLSMPTLRYNEISTSENKAPLPSCSMTAGFEAEDFANKTGSRLFIPLCPLKKGNFTLPGNDNRHYDIVIDDGFSVNDSIVYNVPASYNIESLPKNMDVETPFGKLNTHITKDGNQVIFTQHVAIYKGRYDKSKYKDLRDFYRQIASAAKLKFVLKKSE